ncbi:ATP-dependent DNA helicase [Marinobacterium rhizophilum]|uniref:AAA family ATPase n=1 Tax=Marinobacterium rhizophilum TaxID=420402 RepID=A0ABY5HHZ3_9GAMM|nr:AAA family ATPase [Marinobacterium rhizophilum]UTW11985.1 AAA family ATPase [Marinobacterium rhizophilum]
MNRQIQLNPDQLEALEAIKHFLNNPDLEAFVLCGSAGTGKTTLVSMIIELVHQLGMESLLVAPTGRAAQILQGKLNWLLPKTLGPVAVSTLHGAIYYMANLSVDDARPEEGLSALHMDFTIRKQGNPFDLMIVDEASMVGNTALFQPSMRFGSGRLLSDLVGYVQYLYREGIVSRPIKLLFVGDLAQLPPVGSQQSPALSPECLYSNFGLQARRYELTTVMRQGENSGILAWANAIRDWIFHSSGGAVEIPFNGHDIVPADFLSAVRTIANNVRQQQPSAAVVYSNALALDYNLGVREQLWGNPYSPVVVRDKLLVTRNCPSAGLSNGDLVRVVGIHPSSWREQVRLPNGQAVDLYFREMLLKPDASTNESSTIKCMVLENLLFSGHRDLQDCEQFALFELVRQRHPRVDPDSSEFRELLQADLYYNAVQVKFGYAMTCHKAQGGEWQQVIVDPLGVRLDTEDGCRWLYTAVTRASNSLIVVT